ncbi:isoamylase early set domain-containing protein [Nonomuraea endophytica]|uniref:1,4-alpha-glucan branching enzyme n=1 Tax=Nonomuraea endophytica TaxID=714136 RepID=A0A7W8AI71_9ACTN|nr:isoamylase early set domain-containing protein [Nonomuraea endophytica]MBB5085323.1 1,4-alpha-glucan branching enzyme [Nonomuraea endophytica]
MEILFTLPREAGPVSVVGDFNGWDPLAHPMTLGEDGHYRVAVAVPQGEAFAFRYLADGGRWFDDEAADEYDHRGAVFRVAAPARRTTDRTTTDRIITGRATAAKPRATAAKPRAATAKIAR